MGDATCKQCIRKLNGQPIWEFAKARGLGNPARTEMGHAMLFTKTGRRAVCIS